MISVESRTHGKEQNRPTTTFEELSFRRIRGEKNRTECRRELEPCGHPNGLVFGPGILRIRTLLGTRHRLNHHDGMDAGKANHPQGLLHEPFLQFVVLQTPTHLNTHQTVNTRPRLASLEEDLELFHPPRIERFGLDGSTDQDNV